MYQAFLAISANAHAHADKFLSKRAFKGKLTPRQIYALAAYQITCVDKTAESVAEKLGFHAGRVSPPFSSSVVSTAVSSAGSTAVSAAPSIAPSVAPSAASSTIASETTCMTTILANARGQSPIQCV